MKLGRRPEEIPALTLPAGAPATSENALYDWLFENGVPPELRGGGTAGPGVSDLMFKEVRWGKPEEDLKAWKDALGAGLRNAVAAAVDVAGGKAANLAGASGPTTPSQRGRSWFMARYLVRLVFCGAATFDEGFVRPEEIAGRVRVKGRGGTVLQPGLDLLQESRDFPPDGPILIITDGYCDSLHTRRDHAFLVPAGNNLPFRPNGPVFWVNREPKAPGWSLASPGSLSPPGWF